MWDTNSREVIHRLPVTEGRAFKPHWNHDGTLLALPFGKGTRIVDAKAGETIQTLEDGDGPTNSAANFSPDGKRLLICTFDEVVTIWDVETGKALKHLKGHTDDIRSAEFSPDGNRVVTASRDGTVKIWDAEANNEPLFLAETRKENILTCPPPAFSPDNSQIAYSNEAVLKICDATNGKILRELPPLESRIRAFHFFPDGQHILIDLSVSYRDTIKLIVFNLTTLERRDIQVDAAPTSRAASLSPNGRFIAVMDYEFHVNLLDADTGKLVRRLDGHTGMVFSMSFSPDSNRIVTSGDVEDKTARVWDVHTGKELARFEGHGQSEESFIVWSVGFSPDGTRVVSLASRNTIVWNAQTGEQILTLQSFADGYHGAMLKYSPNGNRILVSNDVGVSIFDAESGNHLFNLRSTSPNISRHVSVISDGNRIAISTKEGVEIHDSGPFPHSALANP